jgi:hypothetical protein
MNNIDKQENIDEKLKRQKKWGTIFLFSFLLIALIGWWFIPNIDLKYKLIFSFLLIGITSFRWIIVLIKTTLYWKKWEYKEDVNDSTDAYKDKSLYIWNELKKNYLISVIIRDFLNLIGLILTIVGIVIIIRDKDIVYDSIDQIFYSDWMLIFYFSILNGLISMPFFWINRITVVKIFRQDNFFENITLEKNKWILKKESNLNNFLWFHNFFIIGSILSIITYRDIEKNNKYTPEVEIEDEIMNN